VTAQVDCTGTWLGEGTVCSPNPCPVPTTAACCFRNASCRILEPNRCLLLRGTPLELGTVCSPDPCGTVPPPGQEEEPNSTHETWGQIKNRYR
jgi:hypothetical protein